MLVVKSSIAIFMLSLAAAVASGATCDAGARRTDCGKYSWERDGTGSTLFVHGRCCRLCRHHRGRVRGQGVLLEPSGGERS